MNETRKDDKITLNLSSVQLFRSDIYFLQAWLFFISFVPPDYWVDEKRFI